jgi:predicted acylesterase/phospholipase RssA
MHFVPGRFVCATSKQTRRTVVLSSYYSSRRGTDLLNVCKIWEAARATSAATTFFEGITIDKEDFVDGATGANNPLHELWTEANDTWRVADGPWRLEDNVACVVSIGTGSPSIRLFKDDVIGISGTLRDIATNCERAAEDFQRHHQELKGRFFRFNVQGGLGDIGLERVDKVKDIIAATRGYLEPEAVRELIEQCGLLLKESPCR